MIEKPILKRLPHWVLTDKHPAFNDIESVTAIEMVARLYGKMQELIDDYNTYVDMINEEIERFEKDMTESWEEFKNCITQIMNDYIATIDAKMNSQDAKIDKAIADQNARIEEKFAEIDQEFADQNDVIAEAVEYMKTNLIQTVTNLFMELVEAGEITAELQTTYIEDEMELLIELRVESNG